jgi:CHAT domain-containing protein
MRFLLPPIFRSSYYTCRIKDWKLLIIPQGTNGLIKTILFFKKSPSSRHLLLKNRMKLSLSVITSIVVLMNSYGQSPNDPANVEYETGLSRIAQRNAEEALPHFKKAIALANEGSELQIKAIYQMAVCINYAKEQEQPEIIRNTLKGLTYLKKEHRKDSFAADFYFRAGLAYQADYQPDSALHAFNEARKMYEALSGKNCVQASDCYHCMGDVYSHSLYDYNSAEALYEKALGVREKGEKTILNFYLVFKLYSELASVNRSQHELSKALAYALKYVAYTDTIPYAKYKEESYSIAAEIYRDMGQFDEAEQLYNRAIELSQKSGKSDEKSILAGHYLGIAEISERQGLIDEAIMQYRKAITLFNSQQGPKSIKHIYCFQRLGELYLKKGKQDEAIKTLRNGLALLGEYGLLKSGQASGLHNSIAEYFIAVRQPDSAFVHFQKGLIAGSKKFQSLNHNHNPAIGSVELKDYCYEILTRKASLLNRMFKEHKDVHYAISAMEALTLAEQLLTSMRADMDSDDSKLNFLDSNFDVYEQMLALLYQVQAVIPSDSLNRMVFRYMESSKSKMLAEALNEARFSDTSLANDSLIQLLASYKRNLHHLQDELKQVNSAGLKDRFQSIQNSIIETDRKIQLTEMEVNRRYPSYLKIRHLNLIPQLNDMMGYTKEKKVSIIEFFWGTEYVYALGIQGDQIIFKQIGSRIDLQNLILPVRDFFKQQEYSFAENTVTTFNKQTYALYLKLIAPFLSLLDDNTRVVIIPDGIISQIPFEVLTTTALNSSKINFLNLPYLLKSYIISYSFSCSYLVNKKDEKVVSPKMLAFGFTGNSELRSGGNTQNESDEIAGSEQELNSLSLKFPNGKFYFGKNVTESKFKNMASDYDIIHLAVHGKGDTELNYSASLFFRDRQSKEDGVLHWYELFGMHLKARLAVISSCESGVGKAYRGEGMLSMANAFAYAGCPNIVMGLWKVDDRTSSELMNFFYDKLLRHKSVDESLTLAKRQYLQNADELSAHPRLWASLIAYGNDEVIENRNPLWLYISACIVIALLLIGIAIKKGLSKNSPLL